MLHFVLPDAGESHAGDEVVLTGSEAHHAATVRRLRVGEGVTIGDGRGVWLTGESVAVSAPEVRVRIRVREDVPAPAPRIMLVQALAKGDRDELAVQAATELGVDEIVPWQAARSVSRWEGAKRDKGRARWTAIVREAAKQSHRAWIPDVGDVATTADLAARAGLTRTLVLDPTAPVRLATHSLDPADPRDILLVVGPEGGITGDELTALESAGGTRARLGGEVLRTSTAGPAALAVVAVALGRW